MFIAYRVAQRNCKFYGLNWFDKNDNLMDLATIFFRLAPPQMEKKFCIRVFNGRIWASIQYQITMEHKY